MFGRNWLSRRICGSVPDTEQCANLHLQHLSSYSGAGSCGLGSGSGFVLDRMSPSDAGLAAVTAASKHQIVEVICASTAYDIAQGPAGWGSRQRNLLNRGRLFDSGRWDDLLNNAEAAMGRPAGQTRASPEQSMFEHKLAKALYLAQQGELSHAARELRSGGLGALWEFGTARKACFCFLRKCAIALVKKMWLKNRN